jgi:tetratricopeptide (TPR) repeat protein
VREVPAVPASKLLSPNVVVHNDYCKQGNFRGRVRVKKAKNLELAVMINQRAGKLPRALIACLLVCAFAELGSSQNQRLPDVIYMDQPTGIELSVYRATWPSLAPLIDRLKASQTTEVESDLQRWAAAGDVSDGELNLLAQIAWQRGELNVADIAAAKAVALNPKQSLNAYQGAMVNFAHLRRASGLLDQWKWQRRTRDAYQRTFDLDPSNISARYYLAYTYMNTPWIGGGDKDKALALSEGGIALGQNGFYVVRADAHRLRGEIDAANTDYEKAISLKVFKLSGFVDAAQEEITRKEFHRAKLYLDWAVHCRRDATKAYEGMGDYYLAVNDREQAKHSYESAIQRDGNNQSAKDKLARLGGKNQ